MLDIALKAKLPMVGVTTEDVFHVEEVLQSIAGCVPQELTASLTAASLYKVNTILWSKNSKMATAANFELLKEKAKTLVFVNSDHSPLVFDAGVLAPPKDLILKRAAYYVGETAAPGVAPVLHGLTLKEMDELLCLTSAKFGDLSQKSIRAMRYALGKPIQGLYPVDTKTGFYLPHKPLQEWIALNGKYFLSKTVYADLRPRGMLLDGEPGTGKSVAAQYIARAWGLPLYRLDIGTSMGKYAGESEARLFAILNQVEASSPCVLLLDEVEKVFVQDSDGGILSRMMGQLLWWLSEHRSQVFTVMTTNNKDRIPPELFRAGRVSKVMTIPPMDHQQAHVFACEYLRLLLSPQTPTLLQINSLKFAKGTGHTAASIISYVLHEVKENNWITP